MLVGDVIGDAIVLVLAGEVVTEVHKAGLEELKVKSVDEVQVAVDLHVACWDALEVVERLHWWSWWW